MSPAYISGALINFTQAHITYDKFHITKLLNKAMNEVRKYERKQHIELKGYKYLFLRNTDKMTKSEISTRSYFLNLYEELGEAFG